jgi:hypothetical protein
MKKGDEVKDENDYVVRNSVSQDRVIVTLCTKELFLCTQYLYLFPLYQTGKTWRRSGWSTSVLRSRNYFYPLRLQLSKSFGSSSGAGSDNSFGTTEPVITDFIFKCTFFMFFMKEYRPNSRARSYSI